MSKIELYLGSKPGAQGFPGWSPVIATVADGTRIVLKVIDWTGGLGVKPDINQYIASTGLTANIAAATDVRGSGAGDTGDNVFLSGSVVIFAKNHSCYFTNSGNNTIKVPAVTQVNGFEYKVISLEDNAFGISLTAGQKLYQATSRSLGSKFEQINFDAGMNFPYGVFFNKGIYEVRCFNDGATTHIYVF